MRIGFAGVLNRCLFHVGLSGQSLFAGIFAKAGSFYQSKGHGVISNALFCFHNNFVKGNDLGWQAAKK